MSYKIALDGLLDALNTHAEANGVDLIQAYDLTSNNLISWIAHLCQKECTGVADELIVGAGSLAREAAGYLALGLARPSLMAMRAQIDLVLSWLFFKDHLIEWQRVQTTGDGFKLKSDVIEYLRQMYPGFGQRMTVLSQIRTRSNEEPYRILSAHLHSQSVSTVPVVTELKDLIVKPPICNDCVQLQNEVSEYIGDVLCAVYLEKWAGLPETIVESLRKRVNSPAQNKILFP